MQRQDISKLMDLIADSSYIVALTGAGISTSAGISTFRGQDGLYSDSNFPGEKFFNYKSFLEDPSLFYTHIPRYLKLIEEAKPTPTHRLLKRLEELGKLKIVITQNVDGLHQQAGNTNVLDLHGNFLSYRCTKCRHKVEINPDLYAQVMQSNIPSCPVEDCDGVLRPEIVFFGEPVHGQEKALTEVQKADLLLVMGTSLSSYPAAELPGYLTIQTKLVIINLEPANYEERAQLVLHEDVNEVAFKTRLVKEEL